MCSNYETNLLNSLNASYQINSLHIDWNMFVFSGDDGDGESEESEESEEGEEEDDY